MTCEDVKSKIQSFLEDLLTPDEYDAFVEHMRGCDKCNQYVRSVGSLSNHVWKLSRLKVPEDLASTIIYRLIHPKEETRVSPFVLKKKHLWGGLGFVFFIAALFFGRAALKGRDVLPKETPAPTVHTEVVFERGAPSASEDRVLFRQLEEMAARRGVSDEAIPEGAAGAGPGDRSVPQEADRPLPQETSTVGRVPVIGDRSLHWHFGAGGADPERLIQSFAALEAGWVFRKGGLLIFSGTGEKIERVLGDMLSLSGDAPFFRDFTHRIPTVRHRPYRVSVFVEGGGGVVSHWHVKSETPDVLARVRNILEEFSGFMEYQSEELVIFSLSADRLRELQRRLRATRASVSEFGAWAPPEGAGRPEPVVFSVYFEDVGS